MSATVTIQAPAKLNLALSVGPAGLGDLHPIASWMVTVDLCDELTVTRLPSDRLSRYAILWHDDAPRRSDIDWSIRDDLAVRAHLAIEQALDTKLPVQLKLEKRIPVGAGLGGGSSNAAAMLQAVCELFDVDLTSDALDRIARSLGADVSFFRHGGSALVSGFGEMIEPHDAMPELDAVLVFPEASCATGAVYGQYDALGPVPLRDADVRALVTSPIDRQALFNDLAAAACVVAPSLRGHLDEVGAVAESPVHVTGSGSSMFILCDDALHAGALAETISARLELPALAVRTFPSTQHVRVD